jgi:hypothetical protein
LTVKDDWPEEVPVTGAEVFEAWFGDLFDEFFSTRQVAKLPGILLGDIFGLTEIVGEIVEFPFVGVRVWALRQVSPKKARAGVVLAIQPS